MTTYTPNHILTQVLTGALLAFLIFFNGVTIATNPPADNPADQQILVYGS